MIFMKKILGSLSTNKDFVNFWSSHSVSVLGTEITQLVIPIIAIVIFEAGPVHMGFLIGLSQVPNILFSLHFGIYVDKVLCKPLMIKLQIVQGILLLAIPGLYVFNLLTLEYLYATVLLTGIARLLFQFSDRVYVTRLLPKENYLEANSKIQISTSVSRSAGPGVGGMLVQIMSAPFAIFFDSLSYFVSAFFLFRIKTEEKKPILTDESTRFIRNLKQGFQFCWNNIPIRSTVLSSIFATAGYGVISALFMLYMIDVLEISPSVVGFIISLGSVVSIFGSIVAPKFSEKFGIGNVLILGTLVPAVGYILISSADMFIVPEVLVLILAQICISLGAPIYYVNEMTLRQQQTPIELMGRVTSFRAFIAGGIAPVSAVLGGWLGSVIGIQAAVSVGATIFLASIIFLLPVRNIRSKEIVNSL